MHGVDEDGVDHKTFLETATFESTKVSLFDSKLHFTTAKSRTNHAQHRLFQARRQASTSASLFMDSLSPTFIEIIKTKQTPPSTI